jgi:two-component system cell cycle response regulator
MDTPWPKVLVVDDDPSMLRLINAYLGRSGYQIRTTTGANAALAAIEDECPHYVITDWLMPGMTGLELCRQIRQLKLPHYVYVLIVTAKSDTADLVEGLRAGADDFLVKPITPEELLARMQTGARVLGLEQQLTELARTDPLTGIPGRRALLEQADRELDRARRYQLPLACAMIDIDFFKKINDTHGHPAGDAVLKEVARLLAANCRGSDYVSRYGGEEFCAVLAETTEHAAIVWAQRVRAAINELRVPVGDQVLKVSVSLGVSEMLDDTASVAALVDMADQALLVAKQAGRDRVVPFSTLREARSLQVAEEGNAFDGVVAENVMSPLVACLSEEETVGQATEFFLRFRLNSCPIVDGRGKLSGILSEKDVIGTMTDPDCWNKPVRDVMKRNVVFYEEGTPLRTVYDFLCRVAIRRVVVVKEGIPTGLISRGTLLRWYSNWLATHGRPALPNLESADRPATSGLTSRQHMSHAATAIAHEASALQEALAGEGDDCLPLLIDRASKIQELINDVLADSRSFLSPTV